VAIHQYALLDDVGWTVIRWINTILESRSVIDTLSGKTLHVSVNRGCLQGLLGYRWLLGELLCSGIWDDIAILINGKFQRTSEVLQTAQGMVQHWCDRTVVHQSKQNGNNTFHHKESLEGLKEVTVFGETVQMSTEVKYLGLTLNKRLTWSTQLEKVMNKA
jgi:hypothetical protein